MNKTDTSSNTSRTSYEFNQQYNNSKKSKDNKDKVDDVSSFYLKSDSPSVDPIKKFTMKINNQAELGKYWVAQKIFDECVRAGYTPNLITHNTLIKAYVYGKRMQKAIIAFRSLIAKSIQPNIVTFNTLVHGCALTANIKGAYYFINLMKSYKIQPDATTFTSLINTCQIAGDTKAIEVAIQLMKNSDVFPNVVTFNSSITDCINNDDLDSALKVFDSMAESGVSPDAWTYTILIKGCAKLENLEKAVELFDALLNHKKNYIPHVTTIGVMMSTYLKTKTPSKAISLFIATAAFGVKHTLHTYTLAITAYIQKEEIKNAQALYQNMNDDNILADDVVYELLLPTCTTSEHANLAFDCFMGLRNAGKKLTNNQLVTVLKLCKATNQEVKSVIIQSHFNTMNTEQFK